MRRESDALPRFEEYEDITVTEPEEQAHEKAEAGSSQAS
jgi:hypothetical protein